jgi:hypothetical protein
MRFGVSFVPVLRWHQITLASNYAGIKLRWHQITLASALSVLDP